MNPPSVKNHGRRDLLYIVVTSLHNDTRPNLNMIANDATVMATRIIIVITGRFWCPEWNPNPNFVSFHFGLSPAHLFLLFIFAYLWPSLVLFINLKQKFTIFGRYVIVKPPSLAFERGYLRALTGSDRVYSRAVADITVTANWLKLPVLGDLPHCWCNVFNTSWRG